MNFAWHVDTAVEWLLLIGVVLIVLLVLIAATVELFR